MRAERRHALHHDQFVEGVVTLGQRVAKHGRAIAIIAVGVVAGIALVLFSVSHARSRAVTAWNELDAASESIDRVVLAADAAAGGPLLEQALKTCRDVASQYPSQPAGQLALLRVGDVLFQRERYDEAAAAYRELLARASLNPEFKGRALRSLAATVEQQGDYEQAASLYRQAMEGAEGALRAEALWDQGRCLERLDKQEQAKMAYEETVRLAPASFFAQLASVRLEAMKQTSEKLPSTRTTSSLDSDARAIDSNATATP